MSLIAPYGASSPFFDTLLETSLSDFDGAGELMIGNIADTSLAELYNSEQVRQL